MKGVIGFKVYFLLEIVAATIIFRCEEAKFELKYNGTTCTISHFHPPFKENYIFVGINALYVRELKFKESKFNQIPHDPLKMYENIRSLDVGDVDLKIIQPGCLHLLQNLDKINAARNTLETLQATAFDGVTSLRWLNVSNNLIGALEPKVFRSLLKLEVLDLSHNRLITIPPLIFLNLVNLRSIFLNNNHLATLHPYTFHSQTYLESLVLNHNYLDQLKIQLRNNHVTYLYAVSNKITKFHLDADNKEFEDHNFFLELGRNRIHVFYISPRLSPTYLSLPYNNLTFIGNITVLSRLQYLDLSYNQLTLLDSVALQNMTQLQELRLSGIGVNEFHRHYFKHQAVMQKLSLSNNQINEIDLEDLALPREIQEIDLSHNNISEMHSRTFNLLTPNHTIKIDMSHNPVPVHKINELVVHSPNVVIISDKPGVNSGNTGNGGSRIVTSGKGATLSSTQLSTLPPPPPRLNERNDDDHNNNITLLHHKLSDIVTNLRELESNAKSVNLSSYRRIENSEHHLKVLNLFLMFLLLIVLCLFIFTIFLYVSIKTRTFR